MRNFHTRVCDGHRNRARDANGTRTRDELDGGSKEGGKQQLDRSARFAERCAWCKAGNSHQRVAASSEPPKVAANRRLLEPTNRKKKRGPYLATGGALERPIPCMNDAVSV